MNREQRNLIERFGPQIIEDVIPVDMLPYLLCLTHSDKEVIAHEETRFGPMRAAQELLSRLRRRPDGFEQFIQALIATGCAHLAHLLDPREQEDLRGTENQDFPEENRREADRPDRELLPFADQVPLDEINHA